jgi:hypothetical protein
MVPNPFRSHVRVEGTGSYVLRLATGGWIEGVEAVGLGPAEGYAIEGNGRKLELRLTPRPGRPREIAFGVRPMGAPVTLQGTRDGRPLRAGEVWIAREAVHPPAVPATLPELEPVDEDKERLSINVLEPPPAGRPGVHLWLQMVAGRSVMRPFDKETCERLRALGYVGSCPG